MRQIVLDTETTGLEVEQGHRIIEIGCVEIANRRATRNNFHRYVNPERAIERAAGEVHGITDEMLADKPRFPELAAELLEYLNGAELIIHNAAFDVSFLNRELERAGVPRKIDEICTVTDTLAMARKLHPGQRVSLDALCRRYSVDNTHREFHGALLDARLLAEVYLAMTGGQTAMALEVEATSERRGLLQRLLAAARPVVLRASEAEREAHGQRLKVIDKASKGRLLWPTQSVG